MDIRYIIDDLDETPIGEDNNASFVPLVGDRVIVWLDEAAQVFVVVRRTLHIFPKGDSPILVTVACVLQETRKGLAAIQGES